MKKLKILYLEDSSHDAELVGRILKNAKMDFDFKLVDKQDEYKQALKEYAPDLVLADHSLFQFNSSEALKMFKDTGIKIPFILVTGTVSEEFAVNILKEGADDYLLKNNLSRLPTAILNSLEKYRLEKERQEYIERIISDQALMTETETLAHIGSWEANTATGEVKWSDEIFHIYGYEPGSVKPGHDIILHHLHPDDRPLYQRAIYSSLQEYDTYSSEIRITDKKGDNKFVYFKIIAKRNAEGMLTRLHGFMQDITEKRKLERELAERELYQQKLITEVTIQAQEKERDQLGRELHDNINQVLASVKMFLGTARDSKADKEDLIRRSLNNVDYAIEEIRKLSKTLVTPSLGDLGLIEALGELAEDINLNKEIQVNLVTDINPEKLIEKNMELMIYRIAQEQLNNIHKYATAQNVVITLKTKAENLFFSVTDDGRGFDTSLKAKGIGLKNISSRVNFYSGKMNLSSAPGKGCTLEITIPF
ncbi:MAG TPA: PAS domain-containing protein [Chitinophagaceae bacterium]|nr:PAS domain-containing protein [Chitinophagaceae bacterium]